MKRDDFVKDMEKRVKKLKHFDTRKMSKLEREEFEAELTNLHNFYMNYSNDIITRWICYYNK